MILNTFFASRAGGTLFAFLCSVVLLASASPSFAAGAPVRKIDPNLQERLAVDEWVRVLVVMRDQVDTRAMESISPYRSVRHEVIVSALQNTARQTQTDLLRSLSDGMQLNTVKRYRSVWITNLVAVEARPDVITEIAAREDVEMVYLDYPVEMIEPLSSTPAVSQPGAAESGLREINANELWDLGITGDGVIVMNIDTGVDGSHPSFAARWRGLEAGVDWSWAWFNPDMPNQQFPTDYGYHGTHTMGTLTGMNPATDDTIGVAVDAQWIAAAWNYSNIPKFVSDVIMEFNWGADPDGDPQTTDDVPAVISNSWGIGVLFGQPPCDASFWAAIDNAEAAGAAVVFAAGNEGPGAMSLRAPADRNTTPTNCFAVGALNPGSLTIASFSSRGPSACPGTVQEKIKPEVCARGVTVRSAYPGGSYTNLDGTSMACPHVAGGLALLRDAFPNATVAELKTALMETAVDLGTGGEDNTYGWGRIDLLAAYESLVGAGGGIPCEDVLVFRARCNQAGNALAAIRIEGDYSGESVTIELDGAPHVVALASNGTFSTGRITVPAGGAGSHLVELVDPAGCLPGITINCGAEEPVDAEWDALWAEAAPQLRQEVGSEVRLLGNHPNPFNPSTSISYAINVDGFVSLKVYNSLGQEVANLVNEFQTAGVKSATWNGRNDAGSTVASGLYFYRLTAGNVVLTEKMMLMK